MGVHAAVELVEAAGDFAAEFEVGNLVLADGNEFGAEREDVGTLADGVEREAKGEFVTKLFIAEFVFDGGIAHHAVEGDQHGEDPGKRVNRRHFGLNQHDGLGRINAHGQPVGGDVDDRLADVGGVGGPRGVGEGVVVGDQEEALIGILQRQARLDGADIMAQVQPPRGRVSGENAGFGHA